MIGYEYGENEEYQLFIAFPLRGWWCYRAIGPIVYNWHLDGSTKAQLGAKDFGFSFRCFCNGGIGVTTADGQSVAASILDGDRIPPYAVQAASVLQMDWYPWLLSRRERAEGSVRRWLDSHWWWSSGAMDGLQEFASMFNTGAFINGQVPSTELKKTESPIEAKFYSAACAYGWVLEPQHRVGEYRLDFADTKRKVAIELDGHEFHKTKKQRTRDASRERDLKSQGWDVIRFTGSEVHRSPFSCVEDCLRILFKKTREHRSA